MTIDNSKLWDLNNPEISELRFRSALATASGDNAFILQTQVARTCGIRGEFSKAQKILADLQPKIQSASVDAKVRYYLELWQTYSSASHAPESQTNEARALARTAYMQAFELARETKLDNLAIDALHMMTFVDTEAEDQIDWFSNWRSPSGAGWKSANDSDCALDDCLDVARARSTERSH